MSGIAVAAGFVDGVQRNRGLFDLMRHAALNQGADDLASFAGFIPAGRNSEFPDPSSSVRYSDQQIYALRARSLFAFALVYIGPKVQPASQTIEWAHGWKQSPSLNDHRPVRG